MACRVCLKESEHKLHIFDEVGVEKHISEILQKHLWFCPLPDDPISSVICEVCWFKVNDFHEFYEAVAEAHTVYKEAYSLLDPTDNLSLHNNHAGELGETLYNIKREEILDETLLQENDENSHTTTNPLYEPEVLENVVVKAEEPETVDLDSLNESYSIKFVENNSTLSSESSEDEDVSSNQSEYLPDEPKTSSPTSLSRMKTRKRTRVTNASMSKTVKKKVIDQNLAKSATTTLKKKREKLCWSKPLDDEIVRKHINLNCELCGFAVEVFTDLISHFRVSHRGTRPFIRCCERRITKRARVVQHAYHHEDPNYFQCEICKRSFSDNYGLRSHMLSYHPAEDELKFQCDQCDKRFSKRYLLKLHKPVHIPVEERKFVCTKCPTPRAFASDHLRQIHDHMQHKRTTNVCHVCAKEIRDNQAFEKHVRLHFEDSGPRVKCPRPGCDRWLKDDDNLKQHLRRHNDEGEIIKCELCGKSLKNRRSLRGHMNYVHSKAIFKCEECKKTFKSAITLKEHMARHSGETLYNCPFCTRTFNSNANMHSHKKKMHPVEWEAWYKTKFGGS